jgi:hypothetical protein
MNRTIFVPVYGVRDITNMTYVTVMMVLLLVPLLVHTTNAQTTSNNTIRVGNQSQPQSWNLWVFIYNVPTNASNIELKVEDNSTDHNKIVSTVVGTDTSVSDHKGPTVMWVNFAIPVNVIGNGTGYSICIAGADIGPRGICRDGFVHNINDTSTYVAYDWFLIPRVHETSNDTNTTSDQGDHGHEV